MITTSTAPTLFVARITFGDALVQTIIIAHLTELAIAEGVSYTPQSLAAIAEDVMSGYGDLKITEIILALRMIREGKFRTGDNDENNRGKFYSTISTGVICDCLNRFRFEYRNPILQRHELKLKAEQQAKDNKKAASPQERDKIIFASCLRDLKVNFYISNFLTKKQMADLQYYVDERKCHLLLRKRVNEFLDKVSAIVGATEDMVTISLTTPQGTIDFTPLYKAMEYLDDKFPVDNGK